MERLDTLEYGIAQGKASLITLVEQILLAESEELSAQKSIVDQLVDHLCEITDIELYPEYFLDKEASDTEQGKAVSMISAAQCAKEYMRTQVFLRGNYQAIQERLSKQEGIRLLYAGTGPFALLVIPILSFFRPDQLQVTLLDIHQESLSAVKKVIQAFGVEQYIDQIFCTDILEWQPDQSDQKYDLIVSETMKAMLEQEPQVSVFRHLIPYLADGGALLPQQIIIEGWLQPEEPESASTYLGEFFSLNCDSALMLHQQKAPEIKQQLAVPSDASPYSSLIFTTSIQVYAGHWLRDRQCSLNKPHRIPRAAPLPGSLIHGHYVFGHYPAFEFNIFKADSVADRAQVAFSNDSLLGVPCLSYIWQMAQKMKHGQLLSKEDQQQVWSLTLDVFDILTIDSRDAMPLLFSCPTGQQVEQFILSANNGEISSKQIQALRCLATDFSNGNKPLI